MQVWDRDEILRFFNAAQVERLYALYVLPAFMGMRRGELFALHWSDMGWKGMEQEGHVSELVVPNRAGDACGGPVSRSFAFAVSHMQPNPLAADRGVP